MAAAQKRGLLLGRNADTAAGLDNVLALAPPLSLTDEDVDHIVDVMTEIFQEEEGDGSARSPPPATRSGVMSDLILAGGTVVTAEGSFRADVAVVRRDDRRGRQWTSPATAPRSSTSRAPASCRASSTATRTWTCPSAAP